MQRQSKQTADDVILHFYMTDSLLITTAEMLREVKHVALNGNFIVTKNKKNSTHKNNNKTSFPGYNLFLNCLLS